MWCTSGPLIPGRPDAPVCPCKTDQTNESTTVNYRSNNHNYREIFSLSPLSLFDQVLLHNLALLLCPKQSRVFSWMTLINENGLNFIPAILTGAPEGPRSPLSHKHTGGRGHWQEEYNQLLLQFTLSLPFNQLQFTLSLPLNQLQFTLSLPLNQLQFTLSLPFNQLQFTLSLPFNQLQFTLSLPFNQLQFTLSLPFNQLQFTLT